MTDTIPAAVFTLWGWTLALAYLVLLPTAVFWLHTLWRASRSIQRYAEECANAAEAIEQAGCAPIPRIEGGGSAGS